MKLALSIVLIFVFNWGTAFSQERDTAFPNVELENYVKFNYDNDFFNATDRYYTQGVSLTFTLPILKYSPVSYGLIRLNKRALNYYTLQLEQNCYTPNNIRHIGVFYGERPFSATFFVSHSLNSINTSKKMLLQTQIDLGIIGPCAKCKEEQIAIHTALVNIQPLGWENQIQGDYVINYRAKFEKGFINKKYFEMMGNVSARLGSLYTDASVGVNLRFGILSPYFNNLGLEKNPIHKKYKFYGVFKLNSKLVGYNAVLQGGLWNKETIYVLSDDKVLRGVFEGFAGVVVAYKRFSLEYGRVYLTPEFYGGLDHGWGKCSIIVCF